VHGRELETKIDIHEIQSHMGRNKHLDNDKLLGIDPKQYTMYITVESAQSSSQ